MKVKNNDFDVHFRCSTALKTAAELKLAAQGFSLSEYLREKLREIIREDNDVSN